MKDDFAKKSIRPEEVRRILNSPEGRQLLALLQRSGSAQQAAQAVREGRTAEAQAMLRPLLEDPAASALLSRLKEG